MGSVPYDQITDAGPADAGPDQAAVPEPQTAMDPIVAQLLGTPMAMNPAGHAVGIALTATEPYMRLRQKKAQARQALVQKKRDLDELLAPDIAKDYQESQNHLARLNQNIVQTLESLRSPAPVRQPDTLGTAQLLTGAVAAAFGIPANEAVNSLYALAKQSGDAKFDAQLQQFGLDRQTLLQQLESLQGQYRDEQRFGRDLRLKAIEQAADKGDKKAQAVYRVLAGINAANAPGEARRWWSQLMDPKNPAYDPDTAAMWKPDVDNREERLLKEQGQKDETFERKKRRDEQIFERTAKLLPLEILGKEHANSIAALREKLLEADVADIPIDRQLLEQRLTNAKLYPAKVLADLQMSHFYAALARANFEKSTQQFNTTLTRLLEQEMYSAYERERKLLIESVSGLQKKLEDTDEKARGPIQREIELAQEKIGSLTEFLRGAGRMQPPALSVTPEAPAVPDLGSQLTPEQRQMLKDAQKRLESAGKGKIVNPGGGRNVDVKAERRKAAEAIRRGAPKAKVAAEFKRRTGQNY